jgi:hypothetical protein
MGKPTKPRSTRKLAAVALPAEPSTGKTVTAGLNLPEDLHTLLPAVAMKRARDISERRRCRPGGRQP